MVVAFSISAVLVLVVAGAAGWLAYQTLLQNGRILLRLERLEEETRLALDILAELEAHPGDAGDAGPIPGLEPGHVVPDFELHTRDGESMTLWEWRGRDVLAVFIDASCTFSRELLPALRDLDLGGDGPVMMLIGAGDPARNEALASTHDLSFPILVQEEREVARLLHADGTPAAYRIDADGRTVGERALGLAAVLKLLGPWRSEAGTETATPAAGDGKAGRREGDDFTPLHFPTTPTDTRIRRTGLRPGEPAPDFRLPDLDGVDRSLTDFRGRPVLLVFSDPDCEPCTAVAPEIERIHRERSDEFQVVMISRGSREANLHHTRDFTFPVVLQRQWEVSRDYAMFATPIAYHIDSTGVVASRPAVGGKAILELADEMSRSEAVELSAGGAPA